MAAPKIPFARKVRKGDAGRDVLAYKRAVSKAFPELYPWPKKGFSDFFGQIFENAIRGSCVVMDIKPRKIIDQEYIDKLRVRKARKDKTQWAFDSYSIKLAQDFYVSFNKTNLRTKIIQAGFYWYAHRSSIHYSQTRPYQKRKPPQIPTVWDCSSFVTNCYYGGGAADPNGRSFDGLGYTGTLLSTGRQISFSKIKPGDLVMFGFSGGKPGFYRGAPTHVAMYTGGGLVLSLGSYPMGYYHYNYRSDINCYVTYDFLEAI